MENKRLEEMNKADLIKEYLGLQEDFKHVTSNSAEVLRIGGYFKVKYHEYRENMRKIAEVMEITHSMKEFARLLVERGISLRADDKPLLSLYDVHAKVMDKDKIEKEAIKESKK